VQGTGPNLSGSVKLDLDLLKPWRVSAAAAATNDDASPPVRHMSQQQPSQVWLEYAYRKHHPALQWLPTKLAEWIANNLQDELGFPDKADPRRGWTPAELNSILQNHVVRNRAGCALTTFGCVEWESELYRGVMRARCYPWNMPKHRFHKMNPQVIPCYPWLYTYITGYPGISLANDAAPGLLLDSPALPVQPGGPL
jgi:hypothetical protein